MKGKSFNPRQSEFFILEVVGPLFLLPPDPWPAWPTLWEKARITLVKSGILGQTPLAPFIASCCIYHGKRVASMLQQ